MSNKLQRALEEQKTSTQQQTLKISGILGMPLNGQRVVEVPNRKGFVYVRLRSNINEVIQAFNNQVAPSYNLPVVVERQDNKYIVIGVDTARYENNWNSHSPYLPRHGNTHSFDIESGGGGDIVWVYPRQFMPALVFPSGSLGAGNLVVSPYTLRNDNGTWRYIGNTGTPNITAHRPTSPTGAVMGLVYLNTDDGNPYFLINSGTVFSNTLTGTSQIIPYIPTITNPAKQIPLAAVRLITGTSQLSWDNIYDVRQFLHNQPTGTSGGGSITVQDEGISQGSATIFNFAGDNVQATVSGGIARIFVTGSAGTGGIDTGTLDARYLKLDASNDPITGQLTIRNNLSLVGTIGLANNLLDLDMQDHEQSVITIFHNPSGTTVQDSTVSITRSPKHNAVFPNPSIDLKDFTTNGFVRGEVISAKLNSIQVTSAHPYATGTSANYLWDTSHVRSPGTTHTSWKVSGTQVAHLDASGTFHSNGQPLIKEAPVDGSSYVRKNAGWIATAAGGGTAPHEPGGRLTLITGTPVMSSGAVNRGVIYYTPYRGNLVPIYNGSSWTEESFSELSLSLDSDTGHTGYHQSGKNFDLFIYNDSGTLRLVSGPAWTDNTTRSTGLEYVNGILMNASSMTARYGTGAGDTLTVARDRGTYVGSFRAKTDGQTTFEIGGAGAGGEPGLLYLWNCYNRVSVGSMVRDTTDSWTYGTNTIRPANNSTDNRVSYIHGLSEDPVYATVVQRVNLAATVGAAANVSIGVDSTTAFSGINGNALNNAASALGTMLTADYDGYPGAGFHFIQWLENSGAGTNTFFGDAGGTNIQGGMAFRSMF